ncbi:hypothetical protein UCDDS831_g02004 [Diplodia seriata]|uniref:Uncharacterized protein n=1 Tax=Diplodia seriata TaxID=420778 RepID=A0A0G2EU43_9PEZI|nr:hypothetical protein UCDDS831_g02004 [Diplodia seriata]
MARSTPLEDVIVDLPECSALVSWRCPYSQQDLFIHYTGGQNSVTFSAAVDGHKPTATFRLRVPIVLQNRSGHYTYIYVYLSPHVIQGIDDDRDVPESVRHPFDANPAGLKFRMSDPPFMVVPSSFPETPLATRYESFGHVLKLLNSLAQATVITVFRHERDPGDFVDALPDIAWDKASWPLTPTPEDLAYLYRGEGGRFLALAHTLPPPEGLSSSLPSYDQAAPPSLPPQYPEERLRTEAPSASLRDKINQKLQELQELVANEMPKETAGAAWKQHDLYKMREMIKGRVGTTLDDLETRLRAMVDKRAKDLVKEAFYASVNTPFEPFEPIDDQVMITQREMHDSIGQAMRDVSDKIRGEIDETATESPLE